MATIESDIEKYLARSVKAAGGVYLKLPALYTTGIPDRLVLMPEGVAAFVELKRPMGGKKAELQKYWNKKLRVLGYMSEFVQTKAEADGLMVRMKRIVEERGGIMYANGGDPDEKVKCLL